MGENFCHLEAELGEEPAVLASAETLLEEVLYFLLDLTANTLASVDLLGVEELAHGLDVKGVSGGHDVVPVGDLDEGLDGRAAHDLALGHALQDLLGGSVDTSDDAVAVLACTLSAVHGLDNDCLATSVSASEHHNNLTGLEEGLCHFFGFCFVLE